VAVTRRSKVHNGRVKKIEGAVVVGRQAAEAWERDFERSWARLAERAKKAGLTEEDVYREVEKHRAGR
jgi:hypothetical protein